MKKLYAELQEKLVLRGEAEDALRVDRFSKSKRIVLTEAELAYGAISGKVSAICRAQAKAEVGR